MKEESMDFTVNMMDSGRGGIPASQAAALAAMGGTVAAYHQAAHPAHQTATATTHHHPTAHLISVTQNHQQQGQHQVAVAAAAAAANQQHNQEHQHQHTQHQQLQHNLHEEEPSGALSDTKPQDITKDESEGAFTPPPRVNSVGSVNSHPDSRAEKGTDTNDFEPYIKIEIRGHLPGITNADKDKNSVMQFHFNSVNEVLHFFSQRPVPQLDAFNLLANPELVRNINPELVRNHFLYVPSSQEGVRVSTNGFTTTGTNITAASSIQSATASPIIVASSSVPPVTANIKPRPIKTERRRGEVPPGTIINKTPPIENNPNQFVCWICGLNLQKSLPFEEHMVEQHNIEKPYRCEDCGVTFKQKAHIDRHRRIHLPTRPYQCGICGKGFTRNEHVRRHSFTHSGEKPYQCPTCNKTFSRQQQLTKHLLTHTKPPRPDSPQPGHPHPGLTTVLLQTTDQNGRLVTINQAAASMTVPSSVVTTAQGGIVTQVTHGGGRGRQPNGEPVARPYQCGVCGKAFIRNEHLRRHMLIHSGEKPHVCGTCGKAFPRREHLSKHLRSHNKTNMSQDNSSSTSASHTALQTSGTASVANVTPQVSLPVTAHTVTNAGIPAGVSVVASSHQPVAAHSGPVTHTIPTSHAPASHSAHLPPGTHYLPMFGLLAEVV
ncbi:Zinc finger protein [Armadillidium nasatum]|uniref:Zinc finger protein n=1 Tax=Armadillidium nasatum TaxID=96803 RepID=A0A5N5TLZ8_9CRUS|nr:Zinc finger protein [Armadillidium nasatum]